MNSIRDRFYYKCDNLFDGINKSDLLKLKKSSVTLLTKKNEIIFKEGSFSDGVYFLNKGKVKIFQLMPSGKFQIVYIYTKGEFFGFRPLLCNAKHPISAETTEECELIFYPKEYFSNYLKDSPVLMKNLLYSLSYEFIIWVNRTTAFSHKAVKERVGLSLLILNEKFKKNEEDKNAIISFGREDLASMSGTTTETCVRILTQFREAKIIESIGREIKIINELELIKIVEVF